MIIIYLLRFCEEFTQDLTFLDFQAFRFISFSKPTKKTQNLKTFEEKKDFRKCPIL